MFAFETETKKLDFSAVDPPADSRVTHTHRQTASAVRQRPPKRTHIECLVRLQDPLLSATAQNQHLRPPEWSGAESRVNDGCKEKVW